jgi:uncharacterized RDD family membrane protein YckC
MLAASLESGSAPNLRSSRAKFVVDGHAAANREAVVAAPVSGEPDSVPGYDQLDANQNAVNAQRPGSDEPTALFFHSDHALPANGDESWRAEVAARLDRYRSRRKPRAPRYPSLRLKFEAPEAAWADVGAATVAVSPSPLPMPSSPATAAALAPALSEPRDAAETGSETAHIALAEWNEEFVPETTGKIIEFPRFGWPPPQAGDELAEPVMTHPRILDVPEIAPPPPALGGILIETEKVEDEERRPGIDVPLQSAPIEKRLLATAIDGLLVLAATALFGYIVFRLAHPALPIVQATSLCAGIAAILWATYQYAFLVHTGTTPGLLAMKLRLSQFNGRAVNQSLRRWRVLVSFLSAASLGMGYAWHFLDEDALCWHDRMTHTYIGPAETAMTMP